MKIHENPWPPHRSPFHINRVYYHDPLIPKNKAGYFLDDDPTFVHERSPWLIYGSNDQTAWAPSSQFQWRNHLSRPHFCRNFLRSQIGFRKTLVVSEGCKECVPRIFLTKNDETKPKKKNTKPHDVVVTSKSWLGIPREGSKKPKSSGVARKRKKKHTSRKCRKTTVAAESKPSEAQKLQGPKLGTIFSTRKKSPCFPGKVFGKVWHPRTHCFTGWLNVCPRWHFQHTSFFTKLPAGKKWQAINEKNKEDPAKKKKKTTPPPLHKKFALKTLQKIQPNYTTKQKNEA